jgi:ABC-type transport system involved in cytochrome c biogenesis permease subunit
MLDRPSLAARVVPWTLAGLVVLWLAAALGSEWRSTAPDGAFDHDAFGKLPVSYGGRFKPLDTVARNTLTILNGRQSMNLAGDALPPIWAQQLLEPGRTPGPDEAYRIPASWWLLMVLAEPARAADFAIFRIDHPEVKSLLGLGDDATLQKRFSYSQIDAGLPGLFDTARQANQVESTQRSAFQNEALELAGNVSMFLGLANHEAIHLIPTEGADDWRPMRGPPDVAPLLAPGPLARDFRQRYDRLFSAYTQNQPEVFNAEVADLRVALAEHDPAISRKAVIEWHFNHFAPFSKTMALYVAAGLLIFFSWLLLPSMLLSSAWKLMAIALLIHTVALGIRVYLSGRPPVTNLYSSAVFVGWGVVMLSMLLEPMLKRGLGLIVGVGVGFATLLIAQGLSADGDTMAVLQAVLDTNFWLATHVIVITYGYVAAYVAGALGIVYVLAGLFTKAVDRPLGRRLAAAIYGTVCFALLLSFVGTILGGIWADQSWGRFWGWDPKENGALMIVIWCAVILHCRWGHMVRERGLALLAILGNVVVSWSWFGVNLLGAGLHSYGFTDAGEGGFLEKLLNPGPKEWLLLFVLSQVLVVLLGLTPLRFWRSFRRPKPAKPPRQPNPGKLQPA